MARASDPSWYATGKNGVPAGTFSGGGEAEVPDASGRGARDATIASPAAGDPRGDVPRSGDATRTVKLTFCVVAGELGGPPTESVSSPSGASTGPMLKSTDSATMARSSA